MKIYSEYRDENTFLLQFPYFVQIMANSMLKKEQ